MNTHDIELPKPFATVYDDVDKVEVDCYSETQVRIAIEADRQARGEPVALMREAALHLTNWLDNDECECEGPGHQCGRTQVERCRDRLLDASPQPQQTPEGYRLQPLSEFDAVMNTRTIPEGHKLVPVGHDASVEAIQYALNADDGMEWLSYWNEGELEVCRRLWPDAPEGCYIGADPMIPETRAMLEADHKASGPVTVRKAFICAACEGVYADQPVSQCDCMPEKNEFIEGTISYPAINQPDHCYAPDGTSQLIDALKWALEWIDAVPSNTPLPTMPGFDRDAVDSLIDAQQKAIRGDSRTIPEGLTDILREAARIIEATPPSQAEKIAAWLRRRANGTFVALTGNMANEIADILENKQ